MTMQSLLTEPGRVDEPRAAQEYSQVLTQGLPRPAGNCSPQWRGPGGRHSS